MVLDLGAIMSIIELPKVAWWNRAPHIAMDDLAFISEHEWETMGIVPIFPRSWGTKNSIYGSANSKS